MPTLPFLYFLFCGITGLALKFKMLNIMESKGSNIKNRPWTNFSWKELKEFKKIIQEEKDSENKTLYHVIYWGQILIIPAYLIGMILIIYFTI